MFGIIVAYDENSSIFGVVSYAWAGLGASFGPLTLCALYWRRANMQGALAGMITGTVTVLVWHNFIKPLGGVFGIYELLPAFVLSFAASSSCRCSRPPRRRRSRTSSTITWTKGEPPSKRSCSSRIVHGCTTSRGGHHNTWWPPLFPVMPDGGLVCGFVTGRIRLRHFDIVPCGGFELAYETRSQPFLTIGANVVSCVQLLPIHTTCSI